MPLPFLPAGCRSKSHRGSGRQTSDAVVGCYRTSGRCTGGPWPPGRCLGPEIDLLVLDGAPQPLDEDVVPPAALAVHADPDVVVLEQSSEVGAGKLAALIGVEDHRGAIAPDRLPHRI